MSKRNLAAKMIVVSAAALMLSGCADTTSVNSGHNPAWETSMSQSSTVDAETAAELDKAIPQYSHAGYTATFLPLTSALEGDKKITKFALKADLPDNCLTADKLDFNPEVKTDACLDFMYVASGPVVQNVERGYAHRPSTNGGTEYLQVTKGHSIIEITSPADTEKVAVNLLGAGRSATIDPMTGNIIRDFVSETPDAPAPLETETPAPDAPTEVTE